MKVYFVNTITGQLHRVDVKTDDRIEMFHSWDGGLTWYPCVSSKYTFRNTFWEWCCNPSAGFPKDDETKYEMFMNFRELTKEERDLLDRNSQRLQ